MQTADRSALPRASCELDLLTGPGAAAWSRLQASPATTVCSYVASGGFCSGVVATETTGPTRGKYLLDRVRGWIRAPLLSLLLGRLQRTKYPDLGWLYFPSLSVRNLLVLLNNEQHLHRQAVFPNMRAGPHGGGRDPHHLGAFCTCKLSLERSCDSGADFILLYTSSY